MHEDAVETAGDGARSFLWEYAVGTIWVFISGLSWIVMGD